MLEAEEQVRIIFEHCFFGRDCVISGLEGVASGNRILDSIVASRRYEP